MKERAVIYFALALSLGFSGCAGDDGRKGWEEKEVILGYEGEARANPFLAAERLSRRMGSAAESRHTLAPLPDTGGVLILPAESVIGIGIARELAGWIRRGGHVIYLVQGGDSARDDFHEMQFVDAFEPPVKADHALLAEFGVTVVADGNAVDEIEIGPTKFRFDVPVGSRIDVRKRIRESDARGSRKSFESGPNDAAVFASYPIGSGRLSVLADATPWRNAFIGEGDHAEFFWEVVSLESSDRVTFVIGVGTNFWALLRHHGWMALIGLFVLVMVWLWKNLTRFGPMLALGGDDSREFTEHVAVTGRFLWSKRRPDVLLDAARRRIRSGLRRTHATLEIDSPETPEFLAAPSAMTPERIRHALKTYGTRDPAAMARLMRDLQKIESSL